MSVYLPVAYEFANHWTKIVLLYCEVFQKFMIVSFIVFWEKGTSSPPSQEKTPKLVYNFILFKPKNGGSNTTFPPLPSLPKAPLKVSSSLTNL